jgi:uncharacterized protein
MAAERIESIDTVRGFAVLGILILNILSFGLPGAAYTNPSVAGGTDPMNLGAWAASYVLADGKMRALFAMLFGASMLLVAERAGDHAVHTHVSRMAVLLLIGLAHGWLVWQGDILTYYAIIGALVFPFWQAKARTLMLAAALILAMQSSIHASGGLQAKRLEAAATASDAGLEAKAEWADFRSSLVPAGERVEAEIAAYRGSWREAFQQRAKDLRFFYTVLFPLVFFLETLAQMLIGMALFRLGWWQGTQPTARYLRVALLTLPAGLLVMALVARGYWLSGFSPTSFFLDEAVRVLVGPAIALGYAALLIAAVKQGLLPRLMARLAAAGRMALSNYLATSLICTALFQGWGFGLFATLGRWQLLLVVLAVWALILAWSKPWLARYRYGPAEWLWRSLSRWERQPMRKVTAQQAPS